MAVDIQAESKRIDAYHDAQIYPGMPVRLVAMMREQRAAAHAKLAEIAMSQALSAPWR